MMPNYRLVSFFVMASLTVNSYAANVSVNSTQPEVAGSSYQTVGAALTYVFSESATPDIVRITGGGPYQEAGLLINKSVEIRGDGYRPILSLTATSGGGVTELNGNGISIFTDGSSGGAITVDLKNFVLIPQAAGVIRGIRSHNNAGGLGSDEIDITLTDILVTSNNGSHAPVSTTGMTMAFDAGQGHISFGDDATFFTGNTDVTAERLICTNILSGTASNDGLVFNTAIPHSVTIGAGCVFSYMNRCGIQIASDANTIRIEGTAAEPVIIKGNRINATSNPALALWGDDLGNDALKTVLRYVIIHDNNAFGLQQNLPNTSNVSSIVAIDADHLAIFNNQQAGISQPLGTSRANVVKNSTIINNGLQAATSPQISFEGTLPGSYTFTNCIIGGDSTSGVAGTADNLILNNGASFNLTFENCGIITAGQYALAPAKYFLGGTGLAPTETNVIFDDPLIQNVSSQYTDANFLAVTAGAYDNAGTNGSDLTGYGAYIAANIQGWKLY